MDVSVSRLHSAVIGFTDRERTQLIHALDQLLANGDVPLRWEGLTADDIECLGRLRTALAEAGG